MTQFIPTPPTPSKPGSFPPTPSSTKIPIAPPPWTLRAKSWTFLYTDPPSSSPDPPQNPNNTPQILQDNLPAGSYHPLETIHASALERLANGSPQYQKSWLKAVMIIRYEETDIGPYDELILVPGRAMNPSTGKAEMRISNIYVSTDASVWNGRRNWSTSSSLTPSSPTPPFSSRVNKANGWVVRADIPKHRATFIFTPLPHSNATELRVYHPPNTPAPLDPSRPFFTVLLKDSALPTIPLPRLAPIPIVQPPLARSRWPPGIQDAVIGTDDPENGRENPWLRIWPSFKGRWGLAYADTLRDEEGEEGLEFYGDGVGFPRVRFRAVGAYFEGVVGFGVADVVG
ncbi:uncharacterized protein DSM5745_08493 [Aspergillus mulundensis]|uniref:Uncharacterized protein n=1 Tax=Aspergillus mulundensis TaxID=1810919 RepID=A0A3D8R3V0_9EURO|nr:Uncharacterized protein DSM5745_08493 [Aspergillus mulundensis]RDW68733.1 Uncharacterized protein DSM5745_08493 [Aspergillus mulundensis]